MAYSSKLIVCVLAAVPLFAQDSRAPILVELFTSEGCSDCPPADRILEQLDPRVVVMSEHVDYWNHQGWADPFSSHDLTARQEAYSRRFHTDGPYTPQMVIDGTAQFVGNDAARASRELNAAAPRPKASVKLARTNSGVQVAVSSAHAGTGVFLVLADNSGESNVSAGENKGQKLHHVAIARSLRKVGRIDSEGTFQKEIALPAKSREQRVIVFLQDGDTGPVSGAAEVLPD